MAAIRVAEGIRIVFENEDLAGQSLFAQAFFGNGQTTFQDPLAGFVVDDQIKQVVAFGGGVFWMAARVLVESRPIREEGIGRPAIGDESLKNVPENFFNGKVDPSIRRKCQAVFTLKANNAFHHIRPFHLLRLFEGMTSHLRRRTPSRVKGLTANRELSSSGDSIFLNRPS